MPIFCESKINFWGEGSDQIYEWANDGSEGVFFDRVFGRDVEDEDDMSEDAWEEKYKSYRLCNMSCDAYRNNDGSVTVVMSTIRLIPVGVLEKIAEILPNVHAEGQYIQETEEFFGNIVIENGVFLWTNFHNPGKRSGDDDFRFEGFFNDDYETDPYFDEDQREVLKLMKFDRDTMRSSIIHNVYFTKSKTTPKPKKYNYKSSFYFSEQELRAISGDSDAQFEIAKELESREYAANNPEIYNIDNESEQECFYWDYYLMCNSWLMKAFINGNADAQYRLAYRADDLNETEYAKAMYISSLKNGSIEALEDRYFDDDLDKDILAVIEELANKGSVLAMKKLSSYYQDWDDSTNYLKWLERAAATEDAEALYLLADCFSNGKYVEIDTRKAIDLYKKSSEKGSPSASYVLSKVYLLGQGVEKNLKEAIKYLEIAANTTNFKNFYECFLHSLFFDVETLFISYIDANIYFSFLQNKENELYSSISKTVEQQVERIDEMMDYTDEISWVKLNSHFIALILNCYTGDNPIALALGINKNYQKAIEWLYKAEEMGSSDSYFFLGKMYYEGKYVEQDYKKAFEFFITDKNHDIYERQLRENEELCEYYLGEMYLNGYYVDRNIFKAEEYFKTGAEECSEKCKKLLLLVEKQIKDENFKQNKKELKLINSFEKAVFCQNNDEFLKAIELFINLKNYMDSASRVKELENLCIKEFSEMLSKNKIDKAKDFLNKIPTDTDLYSILNAKINVNDNNAIYGKAKSFFVNRKFEKAIEEFSKIKDWKDSSELIKQAEDELKNQIYTEAKEKLKIRYYRTAIEMLSSILDWKDSSELIKQAEIDLKNRVYDDAKTEFETRNYNRAIELFSSILDWKDSSDLIKQAEDDLKNRVYDDAKTEFETRNFRRAIELFSSIPDWKDSSELIKQAEIDLKNRVYDDAKTEFETRNFRRAIELFSSIPDWKDSSELIQQAEDEIQNQIYVEAKAEFSRKHYKRAIILLSSINNWKDSLKVLEEIKNKIYSEGMELIEKDNCSSAVELFELIKDWKDAQSKLEYAKENSKYSVGDEGPAGGTIIYVKDSFSDGWRYIEVGSKVFSKKFFGKMNGFETETEIGSGKSNTQKIVKASKGESTQAKACLEYEQAGYKDWFLPSKDELALFSQLEYIDAKELASSSKNTNLTAWCYQVATKEIKPYGKEIPMKCIPIRYF